MLQNPYFLANIGFDTAENEPANILITKFCIKTAAPAQADPSGDPLLGEGEDAPADAAAVRGSILRCHSFSIYNTLSSN